MYQGGDPAEALYIIAEGSVGLHDPRNPSKPAATFQRYDLFGWQACLIGAPHGYTATCAQDSELLVIPKAAIDALVLNSTQFQQVAHRLLRSSETLGYLSGHQDMDGTAREAWLEFAAKQLVRTQCR